MKNAQQRSGKKTEERENQGYAFPKGEKHRTVNLLRKREVSKREGIEKAFPSPRGHGRVPQREVTVGGTPPQT